MAVLRASLFTIKQGAGKSVGDFIGDFIREPLYTLKFQGIPLQARRANIYVFSAATL